MPNNHDPIDVEYVAKMRAVAEALDEVFNGKDAKKKHTGFALLVFPFGDIDRSRINYIGNAERDDVRLAMKELVARWEGRIIDAGVTQ